MMKEIGEAFGLVFIAIMISCGVPLIIIFKIAFSFYEDKKISLLLYILLGTIGGILWGDISYASLFANYKSSNFVAFCLPFVTGIIIPIMCKFPKTTFFKVVFGFLLTTFIFSPGIASFFPVYLSSGWEDKIVKMIVVLPLEIISYVGGFIGIFVLLILFEISFSFYKDKKVSPLYILLGAMAGFIWGVGCTPEGLLFPNIPFYCHPIAFYFYFVAGTFLGVMCRMPKTVTSKIIFGILLATFVLFPLITPHFYKK